MPPVFGPLSPSKARLWSCAVASSSACSPSHSTKYEASSPSMKLLDHDLGAGCAEGAAEHHVDGVKRFRLGHRDHDALAGGKPVRLHDDRRALLADIGLCFLRIGKMLIGRGRDVVGAAQRLGEILRALQPSCRLGRAERLEAGGIEIVDHAGRDRRIRADHDEIDRIASCRNRSPPDGRRYRSARIRHPWRCRHCPARTRVFPPAETPRSSTPRRVRGRRNRAGGFSWVQPACGDFRRLPVRTSPPAAASTMTVF